MATTATDNAEVERVPALSRLTPMEAKSPDLSAGRTRKTNGSLRPAADEPQTADQRLPLLVVLLASFFLLGVGAGWPLAEPHGQGTSPQPVTEAKPVHPPSPSSDRAFLYDDYPTSQRGPRDGP